MSDEANVVYKGNPRSRGKRSRSRWSPKGFLSPSEARAFWTLASQEPLPWRLIYGLMLFMGLRVHEAVKVRRDEVNLPARRLFVRGKGGVEAWLPIPRVLLGDLERQLRASRGSEWLFPSPRREGHVSKRAVQARVKRIMEAIGRPDGHCHTLRHTFVTLSLLRGGNPRDVQDLARHSSLKITQIYAHAIEESKERLVDDVASFVTKPPDDPVGVSGLSRPRDGGASKARGGVDRE